MVRESAASAASAGGSSSRPASSPAAPPLVPPLPPRGTSPSLPPSVIGGVAMSKAETVLLSATGDVLVSRCRESSQAYMVPYHSHTPSKIWTQRQQRDFATSWWDTNCNGLYTLNQDGTLCPCNAHTTAIDHEYYATANNRGLLGGSPPKGEASDMADSNFRSKENNPQQTPSEASLSSTIPVSPKTPKYGDSSDTGLLPAGDRLVPLPSFDYSHFAEGGNDMIPSTPESNLSQSSVEPKEEAPSLLSSILEIAEQSGVEGMADSFRSKNGSSKPAKPPLQPLLNNVPDEIPELSDGTSSRHGSAQNFKDEQKYDLTPPLVLHGVPTFLSSIPQIRIAQVSANPLGSHVLLISAEALLFSFGLNDHGQLGNGRETSITDKNRGFVTIPTLVTPLLENGGKAIACAAGVDNSLVVIKTDGIRVGRLQEKDRIPRRQKGDDEDDNLFEITRVTSSPPRIIGTEDSDQEQSPPNSKLSTDPAELMCHHQVYGFGRNDCMKLGLVNPAIKDDPAETEDAEEDVLLPRRVALHCNVWPGTTGQPSAGIFAIAASAHHSAALVRRATGAVEMYTWGLAEDGALGPHEAADVISLADNVTSKKSSSKPRRPRTKTKAGGLESKPQRNGEHRKPFPRWKVALPTIVRKLSYSPSYEGSGIYYAPSMGNPVKYPVHIALGPTSTFVVTSNGKCMSFGTSHDGLLGRGPGVTTDAEPKSLSFSGSTSHKPEITSVSVGARHAVALARDGSVYSWGASSGGRLGFGGDPRETAHLPEKDGASNSRQDGIQWTPRRVELPSVSSTFVSRTKHLRTFSDNALPDSIAACSLDEKIGAEEEQTNASRNRQSGAEPVVHACAGYDSTVFVTNTGRVLACGEKSGRLGVGEVSSDVCSPKPMFGGLHLWRQMQS